MRTPRSSSVSASATVTEMWGTKLCRRSARHRAEAQDAEHEGRDEDPERHLRAAVADEVPQHPRSELGRRQREGEDRHREHDADDGDDRGGDRREDRSCGVGRAGVHPRWNVEVAGVRRPVQRVGEGEQRNRGEHEDARDEPERRAQRVAAPSGKVTAATAWNRMGR